MVAAIELYFNQPAELRFRKLWSALEAAGLTTLGSHRDRVHRPHLSLAVADEFPPEATAEALGVLPLEVPLSFQHVGQFPGGILWLGPVPTMALLNLHAEVIRRLDAADIPVSPLYRVGAWVPHSTLSMFARRDAVAKAVPLCYDVLPLDATLMSAAVVDYRINQWRPLPT